jgi:Tol biopolymer transport system component
VTWANQGFDLVIMRIPGGETENTIRLMDITPEEQIISDTTPSSSKAFAATAIQRYNTLAWQPGSGRFLAFMGAINGPTADLYLLDTRTREITQLTDGPSQAIMPNWSPDGQYILHYGVSWVPPFGGAIVGANRLDGTWGVVASTGEVITLPSPKGVSPNFVGWQDDAHYLTYDSDDECYAQDLRSVDIASGETTPIMAASFYYHIARSPENGALLFSSKEGCESSLGEGIFMLLPDQDEPKKLHDKKAFEVDWLSESNVFQAYPEALFSQDGSIRYDPPVYEASFRPAVSRYGYEAWEVNEKNQQGRVVVNLPGSDWRTIFEGSTDQLIWSPADGNLLLIAAKDGSLYAAAYPDFTPRLMGNLGGRVSQAVWIP